MRLFLLILILLPCAVTAQRNLPANVQIHVAGQEPVGYAPCEPSIAIDPTNPDRIVAGAVLDYVYVSEDAGKSWSRDRLKAKDGVFGDPCVVAGPQGDFYYAHLSNPDGKGWETEALLDRIVVQHSKAGKGGKKWNKGSGVGLNGAKDQDKEWLAVSPSGDKLAICWTEFDHYGSELETDSTRILCSTSDRKAKAWSDPVRVSAMQGNCLDGDSTVEGAVPVWIDEMTLGVAWAHGEHIRWNVSEDGGVSFRPHEQYIADIIGGWDHMIPGIGRANGMPVTGIARGGVNKGRLYVNWADQRNGPHDTDVWLIYSDDRGKSWSDPVRVNNDPPGKHQFFTWMAVDPITGFVHVIFYDRRMSERTATDVYVATSTNGGGFFANRRVSESPFVPSPEGFFGDYNNISAYGGRVRPIWTRNEQGVQSIWTALMDEQ